jgi:hypothetical protein
MTDALMLKGDSAVSAGPDAGTIGYRRPALPQGQLARNAVHHAYAVFGGQVTGPGLYWLPLSCTIDPTYATTDLGENRVDSVWFGGEDVGTVCHFLLPESEQPPVLAEIVADLREWLDLPAADLAAMCGVRRRQVYNLLRGETTSTLREEAIRTLHDIVEQLNGFLDGDHERLRAAVLLPVGPSRESIYSAATSQDVVALRDIGSAVIDRLAAGEVRGLIRRPSPRLARFGSARTTQEFLTGDRDEREDDR